MSRPEFIRTLKIRSVNDQELTPRYNRVQFYIPPDEMSTDLSESYLALRCFLTTQQGVVYSKADLEVMASQNVYVSFGNGDAGYSPAALFKTCRLFTGDKRRILSEINFANVLSQTLYSILKDFEGVSSESLFSSGAVVFGQPQSAGAMFPSFVPDSIAQGDQLPIELHIRLHELFPFCKNKNVHLGDARLNGLYMELETEDVRTILRSTVASEKMSCPQEILPPYSDEAGLIASLSLNPYTALTDANSIGQSTDGVLPTNIQQDSSGNQIVIKAPKIFQETQISQPMLPANLTPTSTVTLLGTYTSNILGDLGILTAGGQNVKLNFRLSAIGGNQFLRQDKIVSRYDQTASVAIQQNGTLLITLLGTYQQSNSTTLTATLDSLEFVDIIPTAFVPEAGFNNLYNNKVTVSQAVLTDLQVMGAVSETLVPLTQKFNVEIQIRPFSDDGNAATAIPIQPTSDIFVNPDYPTGRQLYTNSVHHMPLQGTTPQILSVVPNGQNYDITFSDLGMINDNSIVAGFIQNQVAKLNGLSLGGGNTLAVSYEMFITSYNSCQAEGPEYRSLPDYSYLIDKSELVLVQSSDTSIPMSMAYEDFTVEADTIQTSVPVWSRQYTVTEPNVANCLLLLPSYTASNQLPECLISQRRGIESYRVSVNQIDATNRNIVVGTNTSLYPSSLYLESLMDTVGNMSMVPKTLSGQLGVAHSSFPTVTLPQKIYRATDGEQYFVGKPGFVIQFNAYSDLAHNELVQAGQVFLFKHQVKMM
jgi:hypothetical protein